MIDFSNLLHEAQEGLEIHFIRSSGHGGQNVNKRSTCCQIIDHFDYTPYLSEDQREHFESPIVIKCGHHRHQHQNREEAQQIWEARIHELVSHHFEQKHEHIGKLEAIDQEELKDAKMRAHREREYRSIFRQHPVPHDSVVQKTSV